VFVVEDEALLLMTLQDMLDDLGCEMVASAQRLDDAVRKAAELAFDIAVLDVNVAGKRIDPVAELLAGRDLPFVFVTGYERTALPSGFQDRALLAKPYNVNDLEAALRRGLASGVPGRPALG
jgi:CheY-like chemotaxis protein